MCVCTSLLLRPWLSQSYNSTTTFNNIKLVQDIPTGQGRDQNQPTSSRQQWAQSMNVNQSRHPSIYPKSEVRTRSIAPQESTSVYLFEFKIGKNIQFLKWILNRELNIFWVSLTFRLPFNAKNRATWQPCEKAKLV